ncbi:hypothetical protein [Methylosinus sp. KRF6]|uniref:hypothetical protein n=1 Tax=Methylosinus sp. KRF6 TaxID=2846853 RepID=UPI001C0E1D0F|nr:hypothetical protein [Methylosinus sp. KRF6]MBU3890169.1 hypothetical protein [Methylosinus sp. KRF6]
MVDDPTCFAKSQTVGAHFGLTSRRIQNAAGALAVLVRPKKWYTLEGASTSRSRRSAATSAPSWRWHKLAVIMHRMWIDGSAFRFSAQEESSGSPKRGAKRTLAIAS